LSDRFTTEFAHWLNRETWQLWAQDLHERNAIQRRQGCLANFFHFVNPTATGTGNAVSIFTNRRFIIQP
jgi:hypothetical protein